MRKTRSDLVVGIDLDNTIISYNGVFLQEARLRGLVPGYFVGTKREIRDRIRLLPAGEIEWQRLQAHVYGPAIAGAAAAEGVVNFVQMLRSQGAAVSIVSHKTAFPNLSESPVNLRDAARAWLRKSGIIGPDRVPEANLYFEDTRADKIARIVQLRCTHFIDDLEEVFDDPAFPSNVERMLFATAATVPHSRYATYASFREIADVLFAG
jgi:hypothetical protein